MSTEIRLELAFAQRDVSNGALPSEQSIGGYKSAHDLLGFHPIVVDTAGAVGAAFVRLYTQVAQVQKIIADVPYGADLVLRLNGTTASATSSLTAPSGSLTGLTLEFTLEGEDYAVEFEAADDTFDECARRINFATGLSTASVNAANKLVVAGQKTGGLDAQKAGYQYSKLEITGGTALSAIGLSSGEFYGSSTDERLGAGIYSRAFPAALLPTKIELSGSSGSTTAPARIWVAGKR